MQNKTGFAGVEGEVSCVLQDIICVSVDKNYFFPPILNCKIVSVHLQLDNPEEYPLESGQCRVFQ